MDAQTAATLQGIVRRESRSLLVYIGDAFPWTTTVGQPHLAALRQAIKEVADAVTELGRFLVKSRFPPAPLGSYPASFTSWNFLALSFLVPKLTGLERTSIAALEADLKSIKDAAARAPVEALLGHKRHALGILEALSAPAPEAASAG